MDNEISTLEAEVNSTKNMVGHPYTATTASAMSDQTKIYVYTGSETGYTAGHWYYYNGTAWTDGGVYNSVAVNTDTSLTVSGQAADSKAVGDAIDDLDSDLTDVKSALSTKPYESQPWIWELGNIGYSTGNESSSTTRMRTDGYLDNLVTKISSEVGYLALYAWNGSTYVGVWTGTAFATDSNYTHREIDVAYIKTQFPNYKYRVVYFESVSHDIDIQTDAKNILLCNSIVYEFENIEKSIDDIRNDIEETNDKIGDVSEKTDSVFNGLYDINLGEYISNQYVKINGYFANYTGWHRTGYVKIGDLSKHILFSNTANQSNEYNCFYDGAYNKVGSNFDTNGTIIEIPVGAKYFAVSLASEYTVTAKMIFVPLSGKANKNDLGCADAYKHQIPGYWLDDTTNKILYLSDKIASVNAVKRDATLVFFTDAHCEKNAKKSQYIIPYVSSVIGADVIVNGGDNIHQEASTANAEYEYRKFTDFIRDAFKYNYRFVYGNHDLNTANASSMYPDIPVDDLKLTYNFNYEQSIKPWESELNFEQLSTNVEEYAAWNKMHYYWDDNALKIRYIIVNTGNTIQPISQYINNASGTAELYIQLPFVYNAIMNLPDGWSVYVFGHQFFEDTQDREAPSTQLMPSARSLARLLNAIQSKTVCTLGGNASTYLGYNTMDCTGAPDVNIVCMMCGHDHTDMSVVFSGHDASSTTTEGTDASATDSVLVIRTLTDAYQLTWGATMETGTTTEQAFDVVCIDILNKMLRTIRIGAGSNRTFKY